MTDSETLARLVGIGDRLKSGIGANRAEFIAAAAEADFLLSVALGDGHKALRPYSAAVEAYVAGGGDLVHRVNAVIGFFDSCLRIVQADSRPKPTDANATAESVVARVRVFISHASADEPLISQLARLFQSALGLDAAAIRATSADGHRLRGGVDVATQLREELRNVEVVVTVLTRASIASQYVGTERGARSAAERPALRLMTSEVQVSEISGLDSGSHILRAFNATDLHQLVYQVGQALRLKVREPMSYQRDVEAVIARATRQAAPQEAPPVVAPPTAPVSAGIFAQGGAGGHGINIVRAAKKARRVSRPQIDLTYTDEGTKTASRNRRIIAENRGDADAYNVTMEPITIGETVVQANEIGRLHAGSKTEVFACVTSAPGRGEFEQGFADALALTIKRRLDTQPAFPPDPMLDGGEVKIAVAVHWRDYDKGRHSRGFVLRYDYPLSRFRAVDPSLDDD